MSRNVSLASGYFYHIMNRGVEKRDVFLDAADYQRFLSGLSYYRHINPPVKLSTYLRVKSDIRDVYNHKLQESSKRHADVLCYALLPNHFHLLVKQNEDAGISSYLHQLLDSYTKYFNKRYTRVGSLFQGTFKAVLIESDEELLHVSRYIHLNPFTGYLVKSLQESFEYPWSSVKNYLSDSSSFITTTYMLSHFKTLEHYKTFVEEQGGYQRTLAALRSEHLQE